MHVLQLNIVFPDITQPVTPLSIQINANYDALVLEITLIKAKLHFTTSELCRHQD